MKARGSVLREFDAEKERGTRPARGDRPYFICYLTACEGISGALRFSAVASILPLYFSRVVEAWVRLWD